MKSLIKEYSTDDEYRLTYLESSLQHAKTEILLNHFKSTSFLNKDFRHSNKKMLQNKESAMFYFDTYYLIKINGFFYYSIFRYVKDLKYRTLKYEKTNE